MSIGTLSFSIFGPEKVYQTEKGPRNPGSTGGGGSPGAEFISPSAPIRTPGNTGKSQNLSRPRFPCEVTLIPSIGFSEEQMSWCKEPSPGPRTPVGLTNCSSRGSWQGRVAQPSVHSRRGLSSLEEQGVQLQGSQLTPLPSRILFPALPCLTSCWSRCFL